MATRRRDAAEEAFAGGRWRPARAWEEDPAVADGAVKRVLVVGDIHNHDGVLAAALTLAERERCEAVVSVGDFWLQDCSWDTRPRTHTEGYPSLSWAPLMQLAMRAPVPVVVIDGNHEVWPCLAAYAQRPDVVEARAAGRPLHLGGTLWWADRGSTWTWVGDAAAPSAAPSAPTNSSRGSPPTGGPTTKRPAGANLQRLLANTPDGLDVLFCHDAPTAVGGLKGLPEALIPARILAECNEVRHILQTAVEGTKPHLVFHGHWHQTNHEHIRDHNTEVFGLKPRRQSRLHRHRRPRRPQRRLPHPHGGLVPERSGTQPHAAASTTTDDRDLAPSSPPSKPAGSPGGERDADHGSRAQ